MSESRSTGRGHNDVSSDLSRRSKCEHFPHHYSMASKVPLSRKMESREPRTSLGGLTVHHRSELRRDVVDFCPTVKDEMS